MKYGAWTVLEIASPKSRVQCDCGTERWVQTWTLKSGRSTNCGCAKGKPRPAGYRVNRAGITHKSEHPLYDIWRGMKRRCYSTGTRHYHLYGGRGITVCERWLNGDGEHDGFACFVADMGDRPSGTSVDRIDNDGNYEPQNCRWATHSQQTRNMRTTRRVGGEALPDVAERAGVNRNTVAHRIDRGWPPEKILSPKNHSAHRALSDEQVAEIRRQYVAGSKEFGARSLARAYGVHLATIQRALAGYVGE